MKILSVGNFGYGWDHSICDEEHIAGALEDMGHEVERWQREDTFFGSSPQPCDFVLIAQWDGYPENLTDILRKATGAKIVYWAFDYQDGGQVWHERLVDGADLYLSKRLADSKYRHWRWLSQDFAPKFLDRYTSEVEKDIDVLFTGSYLPWAAIRNETLKAVDDAYNLTIHSVTPDAWKAQGFKHVFGPIMDDGLPALIARAKINISIDHTIEAGYWSDRNAQIMACGGLVLFRHVPLSETVFRDHVGYFYDTEGCLEMIGDMLNRPEEDRLIMAEQGYYYAQSYLMVQNRVRDLLTIVGEVL